MISEAVATAIKMETDAIAFYEESANKAHHAFGREMFKGFVKDERRHLAMLQNLFKGMGLKEDFASPRAEIKTVFSMLKDQMMQRAEAVQSELDAIKIALDMEKAGFDFYTIAAANAPTPEEKKLFERLVIEENDHFSILNETYTFLENTGQWFMYEERGIVEG
ncbi:MAG: ferritin family protein [Nitrospirae bacterium]|nr:ferritin family protein [Nitrospirota bacterium]